MIILDRLAGEDDAEPLDQARNRVRLHLELVAGAKLGQGLRRRCGHATHVGELLEEALEPGGRDDLEEPRGLVAGVPEGVPLVARLEDQVAGAADHDLVAKQRADAALEHVAVLVLAEVAVQGRRERPRRHRVLHEREPLVGLGPIDHEPDADASEEPGLAVARSDHPCCGRFHSRSLSFDRRKRRYEKKRRAELEAETRRRITESAVELHGSVGPARTSISAVAERAGVRRSTVYRHFPDEAALFEACSSHWEAANPPPDLGAWAAIADPDERLRTALGELYAFYRRTEPMMEN